MKKILQFFTLIFLIFILTSCSINTYKYENSSKYISNSDFKIETIIKEINISWLNGTINIIQGDNASTSVKEDNFDKYPLYYFLNGQTLNIEFVKSGTDNNIINELNKELTITIPSDLANSIDLNVDLVNGNCNFKDYTSFNDLNIDIVNGNVSIETVSANIIDIELVNGNIDINFLDASKLEIEKVNGAITIENIVEPLSIDIESVNGLDTIHIPADWGYKVDYDAIGNFVSEYDNLTEYGNKLVDIDYQAVNGSLTIKK